jgi:hypothetical protein
MAEPEAAQRIALIENHRMNVGTLSLEWAAQPFVRASLLSDPAPYRRQQNIPQFVLVQR